MTVFKGYFLIFKRNLGTAGVYLLIFIAIALLLQMAASKEAVSDFSAQKLEIAVVDSDKSEFSGCLLEYLKKNHHVSIEAEDKARLSEELYYQGKSVVIRIVKGFEEKSFSGENGILLTNSPGSYHGIYLEQQINNFVSNVLTYHTAGYSITESFKKVQAQKESKVSVMDINGHGGEVPGYSYYFQYLAYLFVCVCGQVLGKILFLFRERAVKNRTMASAVSLLRQNGESVLAFMALGSLIYVICMILAVLIYGKDLLESTNLLWYLLNSFIHMLGALEIAYLVGMLVKKEMQINMIITPVSLGLCFLGGVFVPLNVMGEQIKNVAKFLPTYWYMTTNNLLTDYADITGSVKTEVLTCIGIQVLFLFALAGIVLAVAKYQQQER